ncbi:MAG: hypothetical protein Q4F65_08955 [Propionibacteriaceae bacterium]|nr:hypothetical protein [Propionibacteriaceae bacterium]
MKLFSRSALPSEYAQRLADHIGRRPRVLAWARTQDGVLVALHDRLVQMVDDDVVGLGWHDILRGGWDDEGKAMRWVQMSTGEESRVPLVEAGSFPEVFKERVESTFLFQTAIYPRPGKAVTISARRNLMDEGARVLWTAHPARGVRMDEETVAFTEAELGRLRAEYAF